MNFKRGRGGPNPSNHAASGPMPPQTRIFAKLKRGKCGCTREGIKKLREIKGFLTVLGCCVCAGIVYFFGE